MCCCCRCCENLSAATDNTTCLEHQYPLQPNQEHLEIIQWIGLETAELLPAYITRYYNNLHHQVNRLVKRKAMAISSQGIINIYITIYIYIYVYVE